MKKLRALLSAALMLMLSVSIAVAGTYALFTDKVEVNNHLVAGKLKIGLLRTSHENLVCNEDGMLAKTAVATENVDLTTGNRNAFGLTATDYVAPGSYVSSTLKIQNEDSVAFNYSVVLTLKDGSDEDLAEKLTVYIDDSTEGKLLSECVSPDGYVIVAKSNDTLVKKGENKTFKIKVVFAKEAGNEVQESEVTFDLTVYAEQYVPAETV